jgi:hypothetical protein
MFEDSFVYGGDEPDPALILALAEEFLEWLKTTLGDPSLPTTTEDISAHLQYIDEQWLLDLERTMKTFGE